MSVVTRKGRLACAVLWPTLCLAQSPELVTSQKILEELRVVRTSLERLEKGQKAALALTRIEMDERQVAALQERRQRLSSQEQALAEKIEAARRAEDPSAVSVVQPEGLPADPLASTRASLARSFAEQNTRTLKDITAAREALDLEIVKLKDRLSAMEKVFADALR